MSCGPSPASPNSRRKSAGSSCSMAVSLTRPFAAPSVAIMVGKPPRRYRDDVKPHSLACQTGTLGEVLHGRPPDTRLLPLVQGLRSGKRLTPRLHLDETDQPHGRAGDKVDLPGRRAQPPGEDAVALQHQKRDGDP